MNKKAIALSIDILTVMIISIVVLGLSIFALNMFLSKTKQTAQEVSAQLEQQTLDLLTMSNEKVVLPVFKKEMHRGDSFTFALGIKNYLESAYNFTVKMSFAKAYTKDGQERTIPVNTEKWIFEQLGPYEINAGGKKIVGLPVTAVNAFEDVVYVFNVKVECNGPVSLCRPYGNVQTIEVDVIK